MGGNMPYLSVVTGLHTQNDILPTLTVCLVTRFQYIILDSIYFRDFE